MDTLRVTDSIGIELRLLGLIGAFEYDKYQFSVLASACFVLIMFSMAIQHIITLVYVENIEELTDLLYVLTILIVDIGKLSGLILNRDKITNILDGLNGEFMFPSNWNRLYRSEVAKALRHIKISSRLFTCWVYVAVLSVVVPSFIKKRLIFACYFPFETSYAHSTEGFWTAYIYQMIYCLYMIQTSISMDILTMSLLHCAAVKLKVTRLECVKLCSTTKRCIENINAVRTVVSFHIQSLKFIDDIERIFNLGFFVQCFASGLSICIVMLRVILLDIFTETEQLLGMLFALSAFFNELFYYCHYGNQIKHQSSQLFTSIYLCKWHKLRCRCLNIRNLPAKHTMSIMRSICIMLERTKRPTIVTAGHMINLTYGSCLTICRTGYQAFAVLRDVYK